MKQDQGHKKQIIATGQTVETTGLMLLTFMGYWCIEVKYKNGVRAWFPENELEEFPNSK